MGLDMYLTRRPKYSEDGEIGYWRKANHIHKWFVENVQNGVDDCGFYAVSKDKLLELHKLCKEILEKCVLVEGEVNNGYTLGADGSRVYHKEPGRIVSNPEIAEELLPCQSGFFFGSTDYDEYYIKDIEDTIQIIEDALKEETVYYHSSW